MKKLQKILIVLSILLILISSVAFATNTTTPSNDGIELINLLPGESEPINDETEEDYYPPLSMEEMARGVEEEVVPEMGDFYKVADSVTVEEELDGNVFIIAKDVTLASEVIYGNLFIVAERVNIKSNVTGSAFIAAENITISGGVADAYFVAKDINLEENSFVYRSAKIVAENMTLNGEIYGTFDSFVEKLNLDEKAYVGKIVQHGGELTAKNENQYGELVRVEKTEAEKELEKEVVKDSSKEMVTNVLTKLVTAIFVMGIVLLLANNKMENEITAGEVVKGTFLGIGEIVLIPIICVLLLITIVGIPISLIGIVLYILMFIFGMPFAALKITEVILKDRGEVTNVIKWLVSIVVYFVIALMQWVPYVGGLVSIVLGAYGFSLIVSFILPKKKDKTETHEPEVVKEETKE